MGRAVKKPSLTTWILIGLVAGVVFGTVLPGPAKQLGVLGAISANTPGSGAGLKSPSGSSGSARVIGSGTVQNPLAKPGSVFGG